MRKIFTSIFALLGISLLFISCELMADIWAEILSPIDKIYLYTLDDSGKETTSASIYEDGWIDLNYEIMYSSDSTSSCEVELFSDDESVATVAWQSDTVYDEGKVRVYGISAGDCVITMKSTKYKNESASVNVHVSAKPLKFKERSIKLDKNSSTNNSKQLQYTNTTGKNVYFETSDRYYATVSSSGIVTAVRPGKATISILTTDRKWTDSCEVTVVDSSDASVTITNGSSIPSPFYPGNEFKLECNVAVKAGISSDVTWSSEDSTIVSVNGETGLIKAKNPGTTKIYASLTEVPDKKDTIEVTVNPVPIPANQFFWGKWTRMDKGTTYIVEETYVQFNNKKYDIGSSTDTTLQIQTLGTFTKDSENVIKWHDNDNDIDVPFYRQGGTNLKYKVRVVGFEDSIANSNIIGRAAGSDIVTGKKNIKVKGQSERYSTYDNEGTTDEDGYVELTAPVQGDTQTLTIQDGTEVTVVSGLKIENDGDFMGTIPIVKETEYSLKITGSVADSEKTNGYLYANNYKKYPLTLILTNLSEKVKSETSKVSISCSDPNVSLELVDSDYTIDKITISAMKPGATNEEDPIKLKVSYGELKSIYKDVELDVRVENKRTGRVWIDYVPLRFFAGDMPISIAGKSTARTPSVPPALNGFVIYPDGNSKFFTVSENNSKTLWVPIFGTGYKYEMIFSGATVTGNLANSTEMYYTVAFDTSKPKDVSLDIDIAYDFAEENNSEAKAFDITKYFADNNIEDKSFEAYLEEGDIDFYKFETTSTSTVVH